MNQLQLLSGPIQGEHILLEPLSRAHASGLWRAGAEPEIWRYLPYRPASTLEDAKRWIDETLAMAAGGTEKPFAILLAGEVIGSTRFMDIRPRDKGVEIGGTWITPKFQRTVVNTECKYLLLKEAFENADACRVQLKTDSRNIQSQRAIERLGAVHEGVLRKNLVLPDGYVRDTVYYSILSTEWPEVKSRLERLLGKSALQCPQ